MSFFNFSSQGLIYGLSEKLAKFWMIVTSIIIGINLFLVLTLLQMAPKLQVVAQVLTSSPMTSVQLLQTEPFSQSTSDKKLIDETILRFYLDSRYNTFQDKDEMNYRWGPRGPVAFFSSPGVYRAFSAGLQEKVNTISRNKSSTSIDIISVSRIDNIYTVEFDVYTYMRGQVSKKRRIAVVEVAYSPARRSFNALHSNPFGMYIQKFTETIKKE